MVVREGCGGEDGVEVVCGVEMKCGVMLVIGEAAESRRDMVAPEKRFWQFYVVVLLIRDGSSSRIVLEDSPVVTEIGFSICCIHTNGISDVDFLLLSKTDDIKRSRKSTSDIPSVWIPQIEKPISTNIMENLEEQVETLTKLMASLDIPSEANDEDADIVLDYSSDENPYVDPTSID
ncbi:hypothetical protein Tco_0414231 [Tanacetum coccineum]